MRTRIIWAALGAWAASSAAGAAALQSEIDTSGDYKARQAVQTLIHEHAPMQPAIEEPVEAAAEAMEEAAPAADLEVPAPAETADVNELMAKAAEELGGAATGGATAAEQTVDETIEETLSEKAPALAGASTPGVRAAGHEFDDCQRPLRPDFAVLPSTSSRVIRSRQNRAVAQYNDYVTEANVYMRCLADEAQRDLDAYYKAVSDALDAEQQSMMGELETVREELDDQR